MPVDFLRFPESIENDAEPPNPMVWALLIVVAITIGIILTLSLWPKDRSPQCWQFYTWMIGVPSICWAILLAARIHLHETALLQVQGHNAERARTVEHNTTYARRPIALLSRMVVTPMPEEDANETRKTGQSETDRQRSSLSARIIAGEKSLESKQIRETKEVRLHSDLPRDDYVSSAELLQTLFTRLITDTKPAIDRIPIGVPLEIWLDVEDETAAGATLEAWKRASGRLARSTDAPRILKPDESVMALDEWHDDDSHARFKFVLLVSAQIREDVPAGSGEAAVSMLFGWPELCASLEFEPIAHVHRPVIQSSDRERSVMATALDWGVARTEEVSCIWESGVPDFPRQPARDPARSAVDIDASKRVSVDDALGHTGAASGWLAIALAAEHAAETHGIQLISTSAQQQACWLVVRPLKEVISVSE